MRRSQREDEFVDSRRAVWDELKALLDDDKSLRDASLIERTAALYRAVCADLMRARASGYGTDLVAALDALAGSAHNRIYRAPPADLGAVGSLFARDFPRALRRQGRLFAFAAALFVLPGLVGFFGAQQSRAFATQILPASTLASAEESYSKDLGRDAGGDSMMAGFYVYNNVGIAFRCFATGVLFGLGSVFFLIYNGLVIGAVFGFVASTGHLRNIVTFACGHSAFELTAIVIAATAGLQMGYALVDTKGRSRWGSLRAESKPIAHLVLGAASMLLIAACIEGFWSASPAPAPVKWMFGAANAVLLTLYFTFAGRRA